MTESRKGVPGSPLGYNPHLKRMIRQDGLETLGRSTYDLAEEAAGRGEWALAAELVDYYMQEISRIGEVLFVWGVDILGHRLEHWGTPEPERRAAEAVRGLREFNPSSGDLKRALEACEQKNPEALGQALDKLWTRYLSLHDALVAWIQELLTDMAGEQGEEAVYKSIDRTREKIWKPRYANWFDMTPIQRLQLSVEGMRGHLSGRSRKGEVGLVEEEDRYVMVLDPCGSCGILRRGDPESGRAPYHPAGNTQPYPCTQGRVGVGWYAVHSMIVMEYMCMVEGKPPLRPLEGCDLDGPCRWFIYKDADRVRPEHYTAYGFTPPGE